MSGVDVLFEQNFFLLALRFFFSLTFSITTPEKKTCKNSEIFFRFFLINAKSLELNPKGIFGVFFLFPVAKPVCLVNSPLFLFFFLFEITVAALSFYLKTFQENERRSKDGKKKTKTNDFLRKTTEKQQSVPKNLHGSQAADRHKKSTPISSF